MVSSQSTSFLSTSRKYALGHLIKLEDSISPCSWRLFLCQLLRA